MRRPRCGDSGSWKGMRRRGLLCKRAPQTVRAPPAPGASETQRTSTASPPGAQPQPAGAARTGDRLSGRSARPPPPRRHHPGLRWGAASAQVPRPGRSATSPGACSARPRPLRPDPRAPHRRPVPRPAPTPRRRLPRAARTPQPPPHSSPASSSPTAGASAGAGRRSIARAPGAAAGPRRERQGGARGAPGGSLAARSRLPRAAASTGVRGGAAAVPLGRALGPRAPSPPRRQRFAGGGGSN